MTQDLFKPPAAEVRDPTPERGSAVKAVVFGMLVDLGGTTLFGAILALLYGGLMAAAGRSQQDVNAALLHSESEPLLYGIGLVGGLACSVLGGFVCERIARRRTYQLGIVMACITGLIGLLVGWSIYSLPMNILLVLLTAASVLLGTRLGFRRRAS